ncbi:hypothetical protein [Streptococcus saliviloxodontae]|uniref:Major facilitator superfamily permease n=1 Tax=Streptococcus saliviloxodontae TaxID=1349416 RepID=A0ABS2PNM6_9STRE|nr:hypothetical protein [Streptococcus saliviloxodontae]MBM7637044.1 hypothetical protein [Streptococcus saliviloxodontae]
MKRTVYFYILIGLSLVATLGRFYQAFLAKVKDLTSQLTGDASVDALLKATSKVVTAQHAFETGFFYRTLVLLMLVSLVVSLIYLIRKDSKALFLYLFYLGLTFIEKVISVINSYSFSRLYTDAAVQASARMGTWISVGVSLVVLVIFLCVLAYANKEPKPSDDSL